MVQTCFNKKLCVYENIDVLYVYVCYKKNIV